MQGRLRVYDWEWTRLDGRPLFDLWSYELGDLRAQAQLEQPGEDALVVALEAAIERVEGELALRELEPGLARMALAPSLAELSIRIRAATGRAGGNERGALRLMGAVAGVLGAP